MREKKLLALQIYKAYQMVKLTNCPNRTAKQRYPRNFTLFVVTSYLDKCILQQ